MADIIDINTLFGPWPAAATDLGVDELHALMQRHSVKSACTLSTVGLLLDQNAGNSATMAACTQVANLIPVATFNPLGFYGGEGSQALPNAEGFRMIRLFPSLQGWEPENIAFTSLIKSLAVYPLPIMVDVDRPGFATRLVNAVGENPVLILAGLNEQTLAETIGLMRIHSNVYAETSGLLSAGALKFMIETVGPDKVIYGSGAPVRPMAGVLGVLKHSGLTGPESTAVLSGNAGRLLGL